MSHLARLFLTVCLLVSTHLMMGQFGPFRDYKTGRLSDSAVVIADFNGDGKPDLATANLKSIGGSVSVLLGNGDGTFQQHQDFVLPDHKPCWLATGDFNRDGMADLVTANRDNSVTVLLGKGTGAFETPVTYPTGPGTIFVTVADLNGDGVPDLVVANKGSGQPHFGHTVGVLLGNGDGTFQPEVTYRTGNNPESVAVADLNGNGFSDLAVANYSAGTVSVLLGKGDGSFQPQVMYDTCEFPNCNPTSVVAADFNSDGKLDLAVAVPLKGIEILLGNGDGTFQLPNAFNAAGPTGTIVVADLNEDGNLDLAVTNPGNNAVSVLLGNGDGTFQTYTDYKAGFTPLDLAIGDLNGDGLLDLAIAAYGSDTVAVLLNNGSRFRVAVLFGLQPLPIADLSFPQDLAEY